MPDKQEQACAKAYDLMMSIYDEDSNLNFLFDVVRLGRTKKGDADAIRKLADLIRERFEKAADLLETNGNG